MQTSPRNARKRRGPNKTDKWYAYAMISPIIIGFFVLLFLPLMYSLYLSLTNAGLKGMGDFIGLANYEKLIANDKQFKQVFGNSIYFLAGIVPLSILTSLGLASLLNKQLKCVGIFRTLIYSPVITSVIVWAIVWKYILAVDYGIVNNLLVTLGGSRINWFYNKTLTMPMVIVVSMLHGMGNNVVIFLAAMKNVPNDYYEAACMMIIKGSGGEGKSLLGTVLFGLFGENAKDGSISKIAENPFARADLENINLMIDDDMQLEALKQTHYVKSIVTSRGKMDLEIKGQQSYQGYLYARILAFSNGDLLSLHDHSVGFLRRQLILTTKPKSPDRKDDPDLADKLCEELEGIFLWAFEGLQRLVNNSFRFTESDRAKRNRETARQNANNIELFLESKGYFTRGPEFSCSSKDLIAVYRL